MPVGEASISGGVTVSITRDPALVRTVRLVAAAVARRVGRDDEFVEEVRLAVGEACALLVGERPDDPAEVAEPVTVALAVGDNLRVDVVSKLSRAAHDLPPGHDETVDPWMLLRGLIGDFEVVREGTTTRVSMRWPGDGDG